MATDVLPEHRAESGKPAYAAMTRVLVVDDNKNAAEMLQLLLEAAGHETFIAYRAHEVLALARRTSPDILFLDISLRDMDGYELARQLRALSEAAHSSLVAVTGYGQAEEKERTRATGFDHHLVKPAKPADVLSLLSKTEHCG